MTKLLKKSFVRRLRSDQKGVSAVEFAIIIYPLMHIMIGMMNFGYTFYAYNTIQNMAIDTVRVYVGGGFTANEATLHAKTEAEKFGGQFTVTIDESQPGAVEIVLVGDSSAFELVSFPFASLAQFRDEVTLSYRTTTYNRTPFT